MNIGLIHVRNVKLNLDKALSFDDVLLVPQRSSIYSRRDISLNSFVTRDIEVQIPIISANMPSVTGPVLAYNMWMLGGFSILPRFNTIKEALADWYDVYEKRGYAGISLGVESDETGKRYEALYKAGARTFCIDVAHGHHDRVIDMIKTVKGWYEDVEVIAGNVASGTACYDLAEAGADAIKVGIGPGAACTTREVTGFGVPQLSALMDCVTVKEFFPDLKIIADGGIKNSGDIVKALAFGADTVMLGRLLAGAREAPHPGEYFGNASARINDHRSPEGVEGRIEVEGELEDILKKLTWGIKSGLSYAGVKSIEDLHEERTEFVVTSPQSMLETRTRI